MAGPTNDQRSVLATIVGRDSLSQGTFAFCSGELVGLEPKVYREEFLDDLVLLEAADEENDPLERFGVHSVLRLFRALGGCKMVSFSHNQLTSPFPLTHIRLPRYTSFPSRDTHSYPIKLCEPCYSNHL